MMICHCTMAGTQACKNCPRYKEYFGEQVTGFTDIGKFYEVENRPKGKWSKHKTKSNKNWYECADCGWVHFQKSKFCPNCGLYMFADMSGEE